MNLNRIIANEICKLINREPNEEELQLAMNYLEACADDLTMANDIPGLLEDWRSDQMIQCAGCGQYHLPDQMIVGEDNGEYFCDETCEYEWVNGYTLSQLEVEEYNNK